MRNKYCDITHADYIAKYDVIYFTVNELRRLYKKEYIVKTFSCSMIEKTLTKLDVPPIYYREKVGTIGKISPQPLEANMWKQSAALFAFFVWCVSAECYKHGFNVFKTLDKTDITKCVCDTQRFRYFFPTGYFLWNDEKKEKTKNKEIDRKTMQAIKQGYRPKGADELERKVKEILQKFFF